MSFEEISAHFPRQRVFKGMGSDFADGEGCGENRNFERDYRKVGGPQMCHVANITVYFVPEHLAL